MGREVRRVPPNWKHPLVEHGRHYRPMCDESFDDAAAKWKRAFKAWEEGEREQHKNDDGSHLEFWEWDGLPPFRESYRPAWREGEATWFQMYETFSEGTPVSPPFETLEELARYLSTHGDFWYQQDPSSYDKPTYEQALATVTAGWAPSMLVCGSTIKGPYEAHDAIDGQSIVSK